MLDAALQVPRRWYKKIKENIELYSKEIPILFTRTIMNKELHHELGVFLECLDY